MDSPMPDERDPVSNAFEGQLEALGILPTLHRTPDIIPGFALPFILLATITDNATTESNLLSGANRLDKRLLSIFGSADAPDMMLYVSGIRVEIVSAAETAANLALLTQRLYLRHIYGDNTRYYPLSECIDLWPEVISQGGGDSTIGVAAVTKIGGTRHEAVDFDQPLMVYGRTDTFGIGLDTAVDTTADVKLRVYLYGAAWAPTHGRLSNETPRDGKAGRLMRMRASGYRMIRGSNRKAPVVPISNGRR